MDNFIQVTSANVKDKFFLNPDSIRELRVLQRHDSNDVTELTLNNGNCRRVMETPKQVDELITEFQANYLKDFGLEA